MDRGENLSGQLVSDLRECSTSGPRVDDGQISEDEMMDTLSMESPWRSAVQTYDLFFSSMEFQFNF